MGLLPRARLDAATASDEARYTLFKADTASELNAAINSSGGPHWLRLAPGRFQLDQPIRLGPGAHLDLGRTTIDTSGVAGGYAVRIERIAGAAVEGGTFIGAGSAILVANSTGVTLQNSRFQGLGGVAVVVLESTAVTIWSEHSDRSGHAGVLLLSGARGAVIAQSDFTNGLGASNWDAGIVIGDSPADVSEGPGAIFDKTGFYVLSRPILERMNAPSGNLIFGNVIAHNRSGGVYLDGAVGNTVTQNLIASTSKEGLCLDNGASGNVIAFNRLRRDGDRWGMSDRELALDFVSRWGRDPDGASKAKLPGISIDNAAYNLILGNIFQGNAGGDIKMVRTAYFNRIESNLFEPQTTAGRQAPFPEIEFGAIPLDVPSPNIDAAPSRGNVLLGNGAANGRPVTMAFDPGSTSNVFLAAPDGAR